MVIKSICKGNGKPEHASTEMIDCEACSSSIYSAGLRNVHEELIRAISNEIAESPDMSELTGQIVKMSQAALRSSAGSVMLLDEKNEELYFEIAEGEVSNKLRQMRISAKSGIAGWVVTNSSPLIINDVLSDERFNSQVDKTTGFKTESILCVPLIVHGKTIGVLEVINRPDGTGFTQADLETLSTVAATAAMAIENTRLHQAVVDGYKTTIRALAAAIDAKDHYTQGHSQRVTEYAVMIANHLSLPPKDIDMLEYAGILHDIGKIGVPDTLIRKPGHLEPDERRIMKQHPAIGAYMLKDIPFLKETSDIVLYHHERYDGQGYPEGILGEDIPIGARILAIADTFDSMTSDRSYRKALTKEYALEEIKLCAGSQFCPVVAEAFLTVIEGQV